MNRSIIVIGAGIAGLTAAYRLAKAGMTVTVIEAEDRPGGRMAERRNGDIIYNTGARLIYPFGRVLMDLIGDVGLTGALIPIRGLSSDCGLDDDRYRIELMPSLRILATPGLSFSERLRLVKFSINALLLRPRVDPDDLTSAGFCDDVTLAEYCDRRIGRNARELLIDPLFRGTRSWDPEDISAAFLMSTLPHMLFRDTVYALDGGMGRLTETISGQLAVRFGARAHRIDATDTDGCRVSIRTGDRSESLESDLVICAVEGAVAAALLGDGARHAAGFLNEVRYNSLGVVHYALADDIPPAMRFSSRIEDTVLSTYQQLPAAPASGRPRAQLYCQLTPEAVQKMAGRIESIEPIVREDVRRRLPDIDSRIVDSFVQWIPHKLPTPYPGYGGKVARFRKRQRDARHRVYFCGDYLRQSLVTGASASGAEAADIVMAHWADHSATAGTTTGYRS